MKKIVTAYCLFTLALGAAAQQRSPQPNTYSDEPQGGFKKENLFVGGTLDLGFSGYTFNIGGSPEIGYTLARWLDAGVLVNLNYASIRADPNYYYNDNVRQRSFNYGAGAFARAYPLPFLFFQVQPEYNWINYNAKDMSTGETASATTQAASFLAGIGYGQRFVGRSSFYIVLMLDLLSQQYSPYRDLNGAALPVIKAGFDIYLHPKR